MFENFESTKSSFLKEQEFVKQLKNIRKSFSYELEKLEVNKDMSANLKANSSTYSEGEASLKPNVFTSLENAQSSNIAIPYLNEQSKIHSTTKKKYQDVFNHTLGFGNVENKEIMRAALHGLIMLQETYEQDMQEYAKGKIRYKNQITKSYRNMDSLNIEDLVTLSTIALNDFNWADNAITYLKAAINIFNGIPTTEKTKQPDGFEQSLLTMKHHLTVYHNEMIAKKDNPFGPDWKLHPYLIDPGG